MLTTIKTALLGLCLVASTTCLPAQSPFNKTINDGVSEHAVGRHLFDQNGLRYGGATNLGPQEAKHLLYYEFPNPDNSSITTGVLVDQLLDGTGAVIGCGTHVSYYPNGSGGLYFGSLPCSTVTALMADLDPGDINTVSDVYTHDYDLTSYRANVDLAINTPRLFGTTAPEYNPFSLTSFQNNFAGDGNAYYLGATRTPVTWGPKNICLAKLNENQTLQWMYEYDYQVFDNLLVTDVINPNSIVLGAKNGSAHSFLINVNAGGGVSAAADFYFNVGSSDYIVVPSDFCATGSSSFASVGSIILPGRTNIFFTTHALPGLGLTSDYSYEHNAMNLDPYQVMRAGDGYVIVGQAYSISNPSTGWGFVLKIQSNGTVDWARKIELGTNDIATAILQKSDGSFWVAGDTDYDKVGTTGRNYTMTHLNANGDLISAFYYRNDFKKSASYLLQSPTGEMIIDGYYNDFKTNRILVRTLPNGEGLLCNSVPSNPEVDAVSITLDSGDMICTSTTVSATLLSPVTATPTYSVDETSCTDCNCE